MTSKLEFNPKLTVNEKEACRVLRPADLVLRDSKSYGEKRLWLFYFKSMVAIEFTKQSKRFHGLWDINDQLCFTNSKQPPMNLRAIDSKLSEDSAKKVCEEYLNQTAFNVILEEDKPTD